MQIASDYVDAFDKLIVAYARIAEPLERFKLLHETYPNNIHLQESFAMFYSDILKFHGEAYKFVRRSSKELLGNSVTGFNANMPGPGWEVFFMTTWGRFQRRFDGIVDDLKAHEKLVDATATAVGQAELRRIKEEVENARREALERVAEEEKDRTTSQYFDIVCWLKTDESEQAKAFDSVASEPLNYPETCDWVLCQSKIASWMRCSTESTFLVLDGNPGTGKSALMTHISTKLRSTGKSLVVSHICTYAQPSSTEYDQILRSILLQLIRYDTNLVAYIHDQFLRKKTRVTQQTLEKIILKVMEAISDSPTNTKYVHVVLDGLEECEKEKEGKILKLLERMEVAASRSATVVCKVLLSSRMSSPVSKRLKRKHVLSLSEEKKAMGEAIAAYASTRLVEVKEKMNLTDVEVENVKNRLVRKADG